MLTDRYYPFYGRRKTGDGSGRPESLVGRLKILSAETELKFFWVTLLIFMPVLMPLFFNLVQESAGYWRGFNLASFTDVFMDFTAVLFFGGFMVFAILLIPASIVLIILYRVFYINYDRTMQELLHTDLSCIILQDSTCQDIYENSLRSFPIASALISRPEKLEDLLNFVSAFIRIFQKKSRHQQIWADELALCSIRFWVVRNFRLIVMTTIFASVFGVAIPWLIYALPFCLLPVFITFVAVRANTLSVTKFLLLELGSISYADPHINLNEQEMTHVRIKAGGYMRRTKE